MGEAPPQELTEVEVLLECVNIPVPRVFVTPDIVFPHLPLVEHPVWNPHIDHFVTPSEGYTPNSITSVDALLASGMTIEKQAVLVNCPFVTSGSSLADNAKPLTKGWVKDQPVVYFDFGPTSAQPGKVYAFVTGLDANGKPQLVHFPKGHSPLRLEWLADGKTLGYVSQQLNYQFWGLAGLPGE